MNDKRFESWWTSNPARVALNPAAKEVARKVWKAAQQDMATELLEINLQKAVTGALEIFLIFINQKCQC